MALVAPNIVRYTIVGTLGGEDCMNVFDIRITEDVLEGREDAIPRVAGDLLNQWSDEIIPFLAAGYTATEVRWVDLDSAAGGTGSVSSTDGTTWPESGGSPDPALPNHTYAKMVKNLENKTRQQRNGALRLGGIVEAATAAGSPNTISAGSRSAYDAAFEALKDGIQEGGVTGSINLVVVHTVDLVFSGYSEIASFSCAPVVGTLRRRMPGYGD